MPKSVVGLNNMSWPNLFPSKICADGIHLQITNLEAATAKAERQKAAAIAEEQQIAKSLGTPSSFPAGQPVRARAPSTGQHPPLKYSRQSMEF